MAALTLALNAYTLGKLTEAARRSGVTPVQMAALALEAALREIDDRAAPRQVAEPAATWLGEAGSASPPSGAGSLTVELVRHATNRIASHASAMGLAPEALASELLDQRLFDYDDFTWIGGDPREDAAANEALDEIGRPWSEVRPRFMALIDEAFGKPE
jgi:hypothetical protein